MKAFALLLVCFVVAGASPVKALEWPLKYEVEEGTVSPDGRFGIIVFHGEISPDGEIEGLDEANYLADLKTRQVVGRIRGSSYFWPHNRVSLNAVWSPDSSRCVVLYHRRWWFEGIELLEIGPSRMKQTNLRGEVRDSLLKAGKDLEGGAVAHFDGCLVRIGCLADDNPKAFEDRETHRVFFTGTYDCKARGWLSADVRPVTLSQFDALLEVVSSWQTGPEEQSFTPDQRLNAVYQALRAIGPVRRFSTLRSQQRAWLASVGPPEKRRRVQVEARIAALERSLWTR
ncbi:lysozyme inhibitor LprI family protein [Luteolibacter sp. LG18]|uniref:lysozyme inhibitor LprI family protein n=1 Tax=Luteolibacter sp. LG18 TaxID=2819286 RepID=UPI002B2CE1BE|nr:hypothetical protein llg_19660 [Luteolibacter sp. LG18]